MRSGLSCIRQQPHDSRSLSRFTIIPSEISDEIIATFGGRDKMKHDVALLSSRPGYTFGLGCDKWEASSYSGITEGWNNEPMIRW